jgi:hypothetical protein
MKYHICMWLWNGWRPVYDRRDAMALTRQLIRYADLPTKTRICLLTDTAKDWYAEPLAALGVVELPLWPDPVGLAMPAAPARYPGSQARGVPNCFRRLELLSPRRQLELGIEPGDVVISIDMDTLVRGSLRHLWRLQGDTFCAMDGKGSRIHGSLWGFVAGKHTDVWESFDPKLSPLQCKRIHHGQRHVGSDQAWLSIKLPHVPLWSEPEGVYSWPRSFPRLAGPRAELAFCSFAGPHKPRGETVKHVTPWLYEHAMLSYTG